MDLNHSLTELNRLFDLCNKDFYEGTLVRPIITIQTCGRKKGVLGWFTPSKVWKESPKEGIDVVENFEVNITAEYLARGADAIIETLLHEMVHLYCTVNEIRDTSNGNRYHNKNYKEIAEKHGLKVSHDKSIGWSVTSLTEETLAIIKGYQINLEDFSYYRSPSLIMKVSASKQFTYICGCKKKSIRSSNPSLHGMCLDCKTNFFRKDGTAIDWED